MSANSVNRNNLLSSLSGRQSEAVCHLDGPLLIVAGPGSGKTRVMAHRIAYLIDEHDVSARNILAVTFTNKAARELRERCEALVPGSWDYLQVRTFHGFCAKILRVDGGRIGVDTAYLIYDQDDQLRTVRRVLEEMDVDTRRFTPRSVLSVISSAKNKGLDEGMFARDVLDRRYQENFSAYFHEIAARTYTRYGELLRGSKALDFDDLLLQTVRLLESIPEVLERYQDNYRYLLIDEFQDTNPLQLRIAKLLASKHRNLCVVGDPDQSIYSWRHADPSNLTEFQKSYPEARMVTLDQSYRSTQVILEAADSVITNNSSRPHKRLWTDNERGQQVVIVEAYDEEEEARSVVEEIARLMEQEDMHPGEVAVMYRINAQSRAVEVACNRTSTPYQLVGGTKFYARKEVKDLLCYLRLAQNPADDAALERVINLPARGISDKTVTQLRTTAGVAGVPMIEIIFSLHPESDEGTRDMASPLRSTLRTRALNSLEQFGALVQRLIEQSLELSPAELIDLSLELSGYARLLNEDREHGDERWENVRELRGSAEQYDGDDSRAQLAEFLESVALVSDVDLLDEAGDTEAITLITLHQAKGLEFDAVFMIGLEEGLLPHSRSIDDPEQLEEERRLCYVGMTRARKHLYMLRAFQRSFRGSRGASVPSRFVGEMPQDLVSNHLTRRASRRSSTMVGDPLAVKHAAASPGPPSGSGARVEYKAADKVCHSHFGEGVVVNAIEAHGDIEVTVAFGGGHGVKRLMLSLANLERVAPEPTPAHDDKLDSVLDIP